MEKVCLNHVRHNKNAKGVRAVLVHRLVLNCFVRTQTKIKELGIEKAHKIQVKHTSLYHMSQIISNLRWQRRDYALASKLKIRSPSCRTFSARTSSTSMARLFASFMSSSALTRAAMDGKLCQSRDHSSSCRRKEFAVK